MHPPKNKFILPDLVQKKLQTHPYAAQILKQLEEVISHLEHRQNIKLLTCLDGGTSAFLAKALTKDSKEIIVKIPLYQQDLGTEFKNEIKALEMIGGRGYVELLNYDKDLKVAYLEQLGKPLGDCGFSISRQIEIICKTLSPSWIPLKESDKFPTTIGVADWFHGYITDSWTKLNQPFSTQLLKTTHDFIKQRKIAFDPQNACLVHGDAHNYNILQEKKGKNDAFKLIDPDGLRSEPAYDLGVIMREWADELMSNPKEKLVERLTFLHQLTGIPTIPIWQWGLIQCVATGMVLLQSGQKEEGQKLISIAESWRDVKQDYKFNQ